MVSSIGYDTEAVRTTLNKTVIMLVVLAPVEVVMISNLKGHRDQPEWLSHVNASVQKVKVATSMSGSSSIHLLKRSSIKKMTPTRC